MTWRMPNANDTADALIGWRIRWKGDAREGVITGTTHVLHRRGELQMVVRWDDEAPDWWATVLSPRTRGIVIAAPEAES